MHQPYTKDEITCRAYEALVKYNINSLPVNVNFQNHVGLLSIQLLARMEKVDVNEYDRNGTMIYQPEYQRYVLFYDIAAPPAETRWLIALAAAYIELYPDRKDDVEFSHVNDTVIDFAYVFIAPDCILDACSISSSEDIMKTCCIPFYRAREKSKRLKVKYNASSAYCTKLNQILSLDFSLFIDDFKQDAFKIIAPTLELYQSPVQKVLMEVRPCLPEKIVHRMSVLYLLFILLAICFNFR